MAKPFKSTHEQIEILKSRGLEFSDISKSELYLFKNNYYNVVNCYSKFLEDSKDHYIDGATFDEIVAIHIFDSELKNILLKNIIAVENYFKSVLAYSFSKEISNQPYAFLEPSNYNKIYYKNSVGLIADLSRLTDIENNKKDSAINHYMKVHNDVPLWVLVNFMTFGQAIKIYNYSKANINHSIAYSLNTVINYEMQTQSIRLSSKDLYIILDSIKNLRNALAHDNKIFGFKSRFNLPYIQELHKDLNIDKTYPRDDVYNIFLILRLFLNESEFYIMNNSIRKRAIKLRQKLHTISVNEVLSSIGFPNDWDKTASLKNNKHH